MRKIKGLADNLDLAGSPLSNEDLVTETLVGLDVEYGPLVVQLAEKDNISWSELQTSLMTFETRLEQWNSLNHIQSPTTNLVSNKQKNNSNQNWRGQSNRSTGRNPCGGRRGRTNKPTCQLCTKVGHTVHNCFYRFDQTYTGAINTVGDGNKESSNANSAYLITQDNLKNQDWYVDSGDFHHVTNNTTVVEQGMLASHNNFITVGNGQRVDIRSTGKSSLQGSSLKLKKLLLVPRISKNLISVSQLTTDNNVSVIFDSHSYTSKQEEL